jgi:hypothetical protein
VRIINQPVKTGWYHGTLYVEAHPPLGEPDAATAAPVALKKIAATLRDRQDYEVDWPWAEGLVMEARGMPLPVRQRGTAGKTQAVSTELW